MILRAHAGRPIRVSCTIVVIAAMSGCASARPAPRATLPPDSLQLLERALRSARPAYATQEEALRSGAYAAPAETRVPSPDPAPAAPPSDRPPAAPPQTLHAYVVQVAAFRDRPSAEIALREARGLLPHLSPAIEIGDGWFRVVLRGWPDATAAESALPDIRSTYPGAWVRRSARP